MLDKIYHYIQMGACQNALLEKLGPEFAKLVACEKGKEFLSGKVAEIKKVVLEKGGSIEKDAMGLIDSKEHETMQKFTDTQKQIEKESPGSLQKAASLQGKNVDDLLGANSIKDQFAKMKQQVSQQFKEQQQQVLGQIDQQEKVQKENIDKQKPHIPIYDQLPEAQQKAAFQEGEKKFQPQIEAKQREIQKTIE